MSTATFCVCLHAAGIISFSTVRLPAPVALRATFNDTLANRHLKTILLWNSFFGEKHFGFGAGHSAFVDAGCAVTDCAIWDQEDGDTDLPHDSFDAVVFHAVDVYRGWLLDGTPRVRSPKQLYTFMMLESPATNKFDLSEEQFNVTMTYRRDSDVYTPYGWFANRSIPSDVVRWTSPSKGAPAWIEPSFEDVQIPRPWSLRKKTKAVAWIVSNCYTPSKREDYVAELARHIEVDVYGYCGALKCDKSSRSKCYQMVEDTYLFYLSFENSLCTDYVTEKFFSILKYNVVPVVYGGADYDKIAPPMSYINARDFASPKELADYLTFLAKNPEEYVKYFWWKKHCQVVSNYAAMFCSLCEMLNDPRRQGEELKDVETWWNGPGVCLSPQKV